MKASKTQMVLASQVDEEDNASGQGPSPERFVDFSSFFMAIQAWSTTLYGTAGTTEFIKTDDHMHDAYALTKRLRPSYMECVENLIDPLIKSRQIGRIDSYRRALDRNVGDPLGWAISAGAFAQACFSRLFGRGKLDIVSNLFTGKSKSSALRVFQATKQEDAASLIHNLASIPSIARMQQPRNWIMKSAKVLNVGLNTFEETVVNAESAVNLATEVRDVNTRLTAADPMDPNTVALQRKKRKLSDQIQEVADSSKNPQVVLGAAVSEVTATQKGVLARIKMSQEQIEATMAEGKVIIAAGAGSGKCVTGDTLVALPQGTYRIDECAKFQSVLSVDVDKNLKFEAADATWLDMGLSRVLEIETRSGIRLRGTPEHPLLTWNGAPTWRKLAEMELGEFVLLRLGYAEKTGTERIGLDEAYALGKCFSLASSMLPDGLMTSSAGERICFLQGLFEACGMHIQGNVPEWLSKGTFLCSSENLARQLQQLFLGLSVVGSLKPEEAPTMSGSLYKGWGVSITATEVTALQKVLTEPGLVNYYPDEVVAIRTVDEEQHVYDFTVPSTHSFIANGIVSHNTRVMAAKVAYALEDQGYHPEQVMATSFTRKSARELQERCVKFSKVPVPDKSMIGRTMHSIAYSIISDYASAALRKSTDAIGQDNVIRNHLVEIAIDQVRGVTILSTMLDYMQKARDYILDNEYTFTSGNYTGWKLGLGWLLCQNGSYDMREGNGILGTSIEQRLKRNVAPSDAQMKWLLTIVHGNFYGRKSVPGLGTMGGAFTDAQLAEFSQVSSMTRRGAKKEKVETENSSYAKQLSKSVYKTKPASPEQWFNLKLGDALFYSAKEAGSFITKYKGNQADPFTMFKEAKTEKVSQGAAIWGAYEWLKRNEPNVMEKTGGRPAMDMDDGIWAVGDLLRDNAQARKAVQSRYKVILVDEAQDSNRSQHRMFEYIAGARNPKTDEPWGKDDPDRPKGGMTADTYALVGDDKQCVASDTLVSTPQGDKCAADLMTGDMVLSYRNGKIVPQVVRHVVPSAWTEGYCIKTTSGRSLTMSPNHKIWATSLDGKPILAEVYLQAHGETGTKVSTNKADFPTHTFEDYRAARVFAENLSADVHESLIVPVGYNKGELSLYLAEQLRVGMCVAVKQDGYLVHELVVSVDKVPGEFIDLDVEDASNFFGGGILSHNSIYSFRSANPAEFIDRSDAYGGEFKTKLLSVNYRSGANIVEAGNQLIQYNTKQIPMACKSHQEEGTGRLRAKRLETHWAVAKDVAETIAAKMSSPEMDTTLDDFGVAVRHNAEADAFEAAFVGKGLLYRRKGSFFKKPLVKSVMAWVKFANATSSAERNYWFFELLTNPQSNLSDAFQSDVEAAAPMNTDYYTWLLKHPLPKYVKDSKLRYLTTLLGNCTQVLNFKQSGATGPELLSEITSLVGTDGKTILTRNQDALPDATDDAVEEKEGVDAVDAAETKGEEVTEDEVEVQVNSEIAVLRGMFDSQKTISSAVKYFDLLTQNSDKTKKDDESKVPAIELLTVHGWKGLEHANMYIIMNQGTFPPARRIMKDKEGQPNEADPRTETEEEYAEHLQEERRLAYVAITRAKESVTVYSSAKNYKEMPAAPSQFIGEACIHTGAELANAGVEGDLPDEDNVQLPPSDLDAESEVLAWEERHSSAKTLAKVWFTVPPVTK
jgi:superfamily I DNA/RNA helicase/intein/homing endonuclease